MSTRREGWQGMNWIRQEKRLAIYIRDGFRCGHCKMDLQTIQPGDGIRIELDHIVPVSKGGSNHQTNLITSCSKCNASRGDKDLEVVHPMFSDQLAIVQQAQKPINVHLAKQILVERKEQKEVQA